MKAKLIILTIIFTIFILPVNSLANTAEIQNIVWGNDYNVKFCEVENATSYKYSLSVNSNKAPTSLFPVTNLKNENGIISFFPQEALKHFNSDKPSVYRIWIIAVDENNNELTSLTPSIGGKIIVSSQISIPPVDEETNYSEKVQEINTEKTEEIKNNAETKITEETKNDTSANLNTENEKNDSETNTKSEETKNNNDNWENPFEDVAENAWYYAPIKFSNQNNLLSGITDNEFCPKSPMTRGMLAQVLYKHSQNDSTKNYSLLFSDVKESAYYYNAIAWICENNISVGMGKNMFKPNEPITREQLITMLYNYSIYLGKDVKSVALDFKQFEDSDAIHSWAKVPLCWAIKNNLIGGRTESILAPREAATRAEFATILMRFLNI